MTSPPSPVPARFRVGITDHMMGGPTLEAEILAPIADIDFLDTRVESELDPARLSSLDALLVWGTPIGAETVRHLARCRALVRYGVGYERIDVAALSAAGIPFANNPDYGTEEVADHALSLILSLQRRLFEHDHRARSYVESWQANSLSPLRRSRGTTVGVVGVGRIGTAVVNRLKPFGYRILGIDPLQPSGHEKAVGYERVDDLNALLAASDIVTLHCPSTRDTKGLVSVEALARFKPGTILARLDDEAARRKDGDAGHPVRAVADGTRPLGGDRAGRLHDPFRRAARRRSLRVSDRAGPAPLARPLSAERQADAGSRVPGALPAHCGAQRRDAGRIGADWRAARRRRSGDDAGLPHRLRQGPRYAAAARASALGVPRRAPTGPRRRRSGPLPPPAPLYRTDQRARRGSRLAGRVERLGLTLSIPPSGCCGMAGTFGHETAHRAISETIYAQSWARHADPASAEATGELLADGYSCRCQVAIMEGAKPRHPVSVLLAHLRARSLSLQPALGPASSRSTMAADNLS